MAQVHVAKNVMLSGSTLVGSHHVRDGHLSEPRRTQRAVERALQDDLKPWVALDPTQTASLLCFSREDSEAFIGAVGQVGKEMGTLARQEEMWQWLKRKSGAGNISGGYTRKRRKLSPLEEKGQRLWLGYDAANRRAPLKQLGKKVPSLLTLFQTARLGKEVFNATVLLQQIRDDNGCILPNYAKETRRVQAAHVDGEDASVLNVIVALHPNTSVLFYDGTATRVVLVKRGMSVAFLETTQHGGDAWLRSSKGAAFFSFRAFFSIALEGRPSSGQGKRSTSSETGMLQVAQETQDAGRVLKAKRLKKNLRRRKRLTKRRP